MAKGRKLPTSRSELLLGNYGYNQGQRTANDALELGEEDIWSIVEGGDHQSATGEWISGASLQSYGSFISYRSSRPPRRADHQVGGLSLAFDDPSDGSSQRMVRKCPPTEREADTPRHHHMSTSAPVNVPDWSKIYRVDSVELLLDSDDGLDDSEIVPPHEYLAREYSRKMAANSVFEGVGRTLKGRDLSRVRDAVWSQTGFNG